VITSHTVPTSAARFSSRVENYIKYRPSYPAAAIDYICEQARLESGAPIADIGSGTGISARLFVERGYQVHALEPNPDMRAAAETLLGAQPNFHSSAAPAENTGLPDAAVKLVISAQAFHWFATPAAVVEFRRILAPGGTIALMWNARKTSETPFLQRYEQLLCTVTSDYERVNHDNITTEQLTELFGTAPVTRTFPNEQRFDWDGLLGRALSSSYVPAPGHPNHADFVQQLRAIFDDTASDGHVSFLYDTRVHVFPS